MSASDDKEAGTSQHFLQPPYDQALQLGLRAFAEFEKQMSPLFARVATNERRRFLRDVYQLAAKKVLMERARTDFENQAQELSNAAEGIQAATSHVRDGSATLLKAADALPHEFVERCELDGIISQLDDLARRLTAQGQELARHAGALRKVKNNDISLVAASPSSLGYLVQPRPMSEVAPDYPAGEQEFESVIRSLLGPAASIQFKFHFPLGRKPTAIDHWLIFAIHNALPKARPGKRSRFNRDKVICMTFEAALGETLRTEAGFKTARRRLSKS